MSYLGYKEKRMKWGKIREYDTQIPSITLYQRIFAERSAELPVHSHPEIELFNVIKGSAYLLAEKEGVTKGIELKEGDIGIISSGRKHSISISSGGILDTIRISSEKMYGITLPLEEGVKREDILKKLKMPIPLVEA